MKEDDLLKKNEISKNIRFCSKPVLKGYNCGSEAYNFGRRIEANFACWSLENWVSLDWCIYPAFNPSMRNFLELNHDILLYNNLPISKVLSYSTGNISLLLREWKYHPLKDGGSRSFGHRKLLMRFLSLI